MENPYSSLSNLSTAWQQGYSEGHRVALGTNPWISKKGYEAAVKESFRLGQMDATLNNQEGAKQALLEQFILFMQDAGYESAVMSLNEMAVLRNELNELISHASDTKDQADVLSDKLSNIELC